MKPLKRLAVLLTGGMVLAAACGNPAGPLTNTGRRTDNAPSNGGLYGSGHDVLSSGGTTVVAEDTTTRNGGMYGSGH